MRIRRYGWAQFVAVLLAVIGWLTLIGGIIGGIAELHDASDAATQVQRGFDSNLGLALMISAVVGWALFVGLAAAISVGVDSASGAAMASGEADGARQAAAASQRSDVAFATTDSPRASASRQLTRQAR